MHVQAIAVLATSLVLGACATTTGSDASCMAEPGQRFVGQKADSATGLAIRKATGAQTLRWGPPRSAMTLDFLHDRVTVAYDDAMTITRVTCG